MHTKAVSSLSETEQQADCRDGTSFPLTLAANPGIDAVIRRKGSFSSDSQFPWELLELDRPSLPQPQYSHLVDGRGGLGTCIFLITVSWCLIICREGLGVVEGMKLTEGRMSLIYPQSLLHHRMAGGSWLACQHWSVGKNHLEQSIDGFSGCFQVQSKSLCLTSDVSQGRGGADRPHIPWSCITNMLNACACLNGLFNKKILSSRLLSILLLFF